MAHKTNFQDFIEPNYKFDDRVNPGADRKQFQTFANALLETIPDEGSPAELYLYNAHLGSCFRKLDEAKDSFVKAKLAFYCKKNSSKDI